LHVVDLEARTQPGEVRDRSNADAVNPTDVSPRCGRYASVLADHRPPYLPDADICGVVEKLGPVSDARLATGDRVVRYVVRSTHVASATPSTSCSTNGR
jgi:NADPH:quinone reductase